MAGPTYIADDPRHVRQIELDGLTALFHRSSGMTHILAPPAPQILAALRVPGDAGALAVRMAEAFDLEGGEEALTARLAELEAAGLIRRA